jgi:carbamoyltransferase
MKPSVFFYMGHDTNLTIYDPEVDEFTIVELERILKDDEGVTETLSQKHYAMMKHGDNKNDILLRGLKSAGYGDREFQYFGSHRLLRNPRKPPDGYIEQMDGLKIPCWDGASALISQTIKDIFKTPPPYDQYVDWEDIVNHHHAHAFCAYGQSGMDKAWAMTYDGGGDNTCFQVTKINSVDDYTSKNEDFNLNAMYNPLSLNHMKRLMATKTDRLDVAGKVMGMGGFSKGLYRRLLRILPVITRTDSDHTFRKYKKSKGMAHLPDHDAQVNSIIQKFIYNYIWDTGINGLQTKPPMDYDYHEITQEDIDEENTIAKTIQIYLEDFLIDYIRSNLKDIEKYDNNVILSGGISLNVIANQKLRKTFPQLKFFVPSNPHDGGLSFGALWEFLAKKGVIKRNDYKITYNGTKILDRDDLGEIKQKYSDHHKVGSLDEVSKLLKDGKILGFVNGKCETGPRALGNRSILADASYPNIKDIINKKVKRREPYRPFAPACLLENAPIYFDSPTFENMEAMQYVVDVKPEYRDKLPAITHVDGTARLQVVEEENNKVFYDLLKSHGGVLLNTSFNLARKPILNTYKDAVYMWRNTAMDGLVIVDDEGEINIFQKGTGV